LQTGYLKLSHAAVMTLHVSYSMVVLPPVVVEMVQPYEHQRGILPLFFYSGTASL